MILRLLAAGALLASACASDRDAPEIVVLANTPGYVSLAWTHPPGPAPGGYQIERSVAGGAFQLIESVDSSYLGYGYVFSPADPEQTMYAFRVRALPDTGGSRASDAATIRRGVQTPFVYCGPDNLVGGCSPINGDHFELHWTPQSSSPDMFQLERRTVSGFQTAVSDWAVLLPPSSATTYSDGDLTEWVHSLAYEYRLTAIGSGGEQGQPFTARTANAPP